MREKAAQGIYPSRPPLGYRNNKVEHTIEGQSRHKSSFWQNACSNYMRVGNIPLRAFAGEKLKEEFEARNLAKSYLAKLLKNPFFFMACSTGRAPSIQEHTLHLSGGDPVRGGTSCFPGPQ